MRDLSWGLQPPHLPREALLTGSGPGAQATVASHGCTTALSPAVRDVTSHNLGLFLEPASTDAKDEPSAGAVIEGGNCLGQQPWVALRHQAISSPRPEPWPASDQPNDQSPHGDRGQAYRQRLPRDAPVVAPEDGAAIG